MSVTVATSPQELAPGLETDWHPMLLARAHPKQEIQADFDRWEIGKHLADLMAGPGAVMVVYGWNVLDGLPEAYKGSGWCMAYYTGRDVEGLFAWLCSKELEEAIKDGSQWFGRFNDVDYETYTGNVYEVTAVVNGAGRTPPESAPILVERFEAGEGEAAELDAWLRDVHLPAIGTHPGVLRARTFRAIRENIPIQYYYSPGNRALIAELADEEGFRETLLSRDFLEHVEDSLRWELRLPYVKRDVYRYAAHAYSEHGGAYY
jgi:hypothetical protein